MTAQPIGMLDTLRSLREQRKRLAALDWRCSRAEVRAFRESSVGTQESDIDKDLVSRAIGLVEYGGANISYSASTVVGHAVRAAVLYYLDKEIKKVAEMAKAEAEAVLALTAEREP